MALLVGSALAFASPITGVIYQGIPDGSNAADPLNQASTLANATFTVGLGGINFDSIVGLNSSAKYTPSLFLNGVSFSNQHNGFNANGDLDNSEIVLTGSIFLASGSNSFQVNHDDGLTLSISGGIGLVLNDAGATAPVLTPFTINNPGAAGVFNFTLDYAECCGPPAVLDFNFQNGNPVGSVPEPNSGLLMASGMMLGLFGLGAAKLRA
ncbi:MAG: hypothetical protein ACRD1L_09000 [Terriglobales bacterium]